MLSEAQLASDTLGCDIILFIDARSQYRSMQETGDLIHNDRFGLLLRNGCAQGDIRDCPVSSEIHCDLHFIYFFLSNGIFMQLSVSREALNGHKF